MSDLVKLYNPANAASLTPEQIAGLQKLSSAEIKELADAYPNMTMNRAYLLIIDSKKPVEKQLPNLSSFQNLWNLREKNGQRNYVAYNFRNNYRPVNNVPVRAKKTEVVDLSDTELLSLPGFKNRGPLGVGELNIISNLPKAPQVKNDLPTEVKVTKVKRVAKEDAPVKIAKRKTK